MRENKRLAKTIGYGLLMILLLIIVILFISFGSYKIATNNKVNDNDGNAEHITPSLPPIGDSTLGEVVEYINSEESYDDQYITDVICSSKEGDNAIDSLSRPSDLIFEQNKLKKTIDINNSIITPDSFNEDSLEGIILGEIEFKFTVNLTNSIFIILNESQVSNNVQ